MDFRSSISQARSYTTSAMSELDRYDRRQSPDSPTNRSIIDRAVSLISPGATRFGAQALDAARWERWVGIRQIRDTGSALEMLDRAYWGLNSSMPDIDGARWNLREAVSLLDRASYGSRWAGQPQTPFASPLVA